MSTQHATAIDNTADIIDTRDIEGRIDWLTGCCDKEEAIELRDLLALRESAEGYCDDWHHGATLIAESYFETYAQELAEDCGMVSDGAEWPNRCIDWEQAARELQMDYTAVEFDGVTYYTR